jgi:hypothetical protein
MAALVIVKQREYIYQIQNTSSYGGFLTVYIYDKLGWVVRLSNISIPAGSIYILNLSADGMYRFGFKDAAGGNAESYFTASIPNIKKYIEEGILRFKGEDPCEDCNNYDFCQLVMLLQSYYMILQLIPADSKFDSVIELDTDYPELKKLFEDVYKIIEYAKQYMPVGTLKK